MKNNQRDFANSKTWLLSLLLLTSDLLGFAFSFGLITLVRKWILQTDNSLLFDPQVIRTISMLTAMSLLVFYIKGLYPGRGRISVVEFKDVTEALLIAYAIVGLYIFIDSRLIVFSRSIYLMSIIFEIVTISIGRIMVRKIIANNYSWWGEPVAIIGTGKNIELIINRLSECKRLGYRPVVALSIDHEIPSIDLKDLKIQHWSVKRQMDAVKRNISIVMLAVSTNELRTKYPSIYHSVGFQFKDTIFMLDNDIYGSMMAQPIDLNGQPAILAHQSLFSTHLRVLKWAFEILASIFLGIPILLISIFVALLIKVDSKGPIFYQQERVGKNLRPFKLLKFRTMYANSDEILEELLEDPVRKDEWERYHKFTDDPRLTKVGKWIRRFSLDELPQFLNVLKGEMSLIGPRPLVQAEIDQMGEIAGVVFKVKPGITGWWQVNGRNNLSFDERTQLDVYYVYNWSLWLDAFIVIKTIWVVFFDRSGR